MATFSIATPKPLDGSTGDNIVKAAPTGSSFGTMGDFPGSGEGVRILIDTAKVKSAGEAWTAVRRLLNDLNDRGAKGWPPAATS